MSLMDRLKDAAALPDGVTAALEETQPEPHAPAVAVESAPAPKKKGLGLRPTYSEDAAVQMSAPSVAQAAPPSEASRVAEPEPQLASPAAPFALVDPNDPVSVIEAAMLARGVKFTALTAAQREDRANVRAWLDEYIHYWPSSPRVVAQPVTGDVDRAAPARPEDESTLAVASRASLLRSRRAQRQRFMQESFGLSNLVRFNSPDGCEYRFPKDNGLAFREQGEHLHFDDVNFNAIRCGIERAIELGWSSIRINGSEAFMSAAFIEATKAGLRIKDYEPTPDDLMKLEALGIKPVGAAAQVQQENNGMECGDDPAPSSDANAPNFAPFNRPGRVARRSPGMM